MSVEVAPVAFGIGVLFDIVRDAVVVADPMTQRIVLWNSGASEIFGYAATEAIGLELRSLVPEELRGQHEAGLRHFAETETGPLIESGRPVEVPALHKDGSTRWIELRLSRLPRPDLQRSFVLAVIRDVTDRREDHAQLARANKALRDFLSLASHDLKSPVAAIAAASAMLSEDRANRPDRDMLVAIIERQTRWLGALVSDFEVVASAESGALAPVPESIIIRELVEDVVGDAAVGIEVDPMARVFADPVHLRRIVSNLLENAVKYGEAPVTVASRNADNGVVVAVTDHGPGVPLDEQPRLFDKFWRGRRSDAPGTGLGLAIVQALAEANGGRAWFENAGDPTFAVWLPATP